LGDSVRGFPQTDCSALPASQKATDEPNRKGHRGYPESPSGCGWIGATSSDGRVTGLAMNYVNTCHPYTPNSEDTKRRSRTSPQQGPASRTLATQTAD